MADSAPRKDLGLALSNEDQVTASGDRWYTIRATREKAGGASYVTGMFLRKEGVLPPESSPTIAVFLVDNGKSFGSEEYLVGANKVQVRCDILEFVLENGKEAIENLTRHPFLAASAFMMLSDGLDQEATVNKIQSAFQVE